MSPLCQDEAGRKPSRRGDSAGSKGTTDSGVVVENRDLVVLPGSVPDKLPPLSSESLRECEVDRVSPNGEFKPQTIRKNRTSSYCAAEGESSLI